MNRLKVLQFPIAVSKGGITQYCLNNWKFIDKNKFKFDFVTFSKSINFANEIERTGSIIHYASCRAEENESEFIREMNLILDNKYDVVHLHTSYWKSFLMEEICKKRGVKKIIIHSHNTDILESQNREYLIKIHNKNKSIISKDIATDFWACSQKAADWLYGEKIPKDEIKIMKNAIDVEKFSFDEMVRKKIRLELNIENCFVLGNVARMSYQKNHEFLIRIFKKIYFKNKNARLLLIGSGELEEEIRKQVREYNLQKAVIFMGWRSDISVLLQAMDLFLLPSRFEGLPIALVEAQSSGLECIVSTCVSEEARITNKIKYIDLDEDSWIKEIKDSSKLIERKNLSQMLTLSGYNIKDEIKKIEKLYLL